MTPQNNIEFVRDFTSQRAKEEKERDIAQLLDILNNGGAKLLIDLRDCYSSSEDRIKENVFDLFSSGQGRDYLAFDIEIVEGNESNSYRLSQLISKELPSLKKIDHIQELIIQRDQVMDINPLKVFEILKNNKDIKKLGFYIPESREIRFMVEVEECIDPIEDLKLNSVLRVLYEWQESRKIEEANKLK